MPIIMPKKPTSNKSFIEASIAYNEKIQKAEKRDAAKQKKREESYLKESIAIMEAKSKTAKIQSRYATFVESMKINLLAEVISDITRSAMKKVNQILEKDIFNENAMYPSVNAITYQFIKENGSGSGIIFNMNRRPSVYLSNINNLIHSTYTSVLEGLSTNLNDDGTGDFKMPSQSMDNFRAKSKEVFGREDIIDSIADRVAESIKDFVQKNAEDKEKIVTALTATKEKIDSLKGASDELKESYARIGRRYITDVRESNHGLFNEMVVAMSKGVMKNDALREEFVHESHLKVDRIISNVATMYTFLETVNTMNLIKVDEAYIREVLDSMEGK